MNSVVLDRKLGKASKTKPPPTEVGGFCACRLKPTGAAISILRNCNYCENRTCSAAAPSCVYAAHDIPLALC